MSEYGYFYYPTWDNNRIIESFWLAELVEHPIVGWLYFKPCRQPCAIILSSCVAFVVRMYHEYSVNL